MFTLNKGGAQVTEDDETELATLGMSAGKVTTLMMQKSDAYKNTHFDSKKPISVDSVLNPAVTRHSNNNNNNDDDEEDNHRGAGERLTRGTCRVVLTCDDRDRLDDRTRRTALGAQQHVLDGRALFDRELRLEQEV
jgi:hypothetical protein